jgi:hypothetical protein
VHFVHRDGTCRAALVAKVFGTAHRRASVFVLNPDFYHTEFQEAVFNQDGMAGTWHHVDTAVPQH